MTDALHAAIDEHPDQATNYLVLADWLQEHGDPRGELIVLAKSSGLDVERRRAALEREIGPAPLRYGAQTWFYGYIRTARGIGDEDNAELVTEYLDHPSLRHATSLDIDLPGREDDDRQWLVAAIAARPRPSLRSLAINAYKRGGNEPPNGELDLGPLWDALPRITKVQVNARHVALGTVRSPTLASLEVDGSIADESSHIGDCPALRTLVLHDVAPTIALRFTRSPLAAQVTNMALTVAGPDRYEQTGE